MKAIVKLTVLLGLPAAMVLGSPAYAQVLVSSADTAQYLSEQAFELAAHGSVESQVQAIRLWQSAAAIERRLGRQRFQAGALMNIGVAYNALYRSDSAIVYLQWARTLFSRIGELRPEAIALNSIGAAYDYLGRPDSAFAYFREAVRLAETVGDSALARVALDNMQRVNWRQ